MREAFERGGVTGDGGSLRCSPNLAPSPSKLTRCLRKNSTPIGKGILLRKGQEKGKKRGLRAKGKGMKIKAIIRQRDELGRNWGWGDGRLNGGLFRLEKARRRQLNMEKMRNKKGKGRMKKRMKRKNCKMRKEKRRKLQGKRRGGGGYREE